MWASTTDDNAVYEQSDKRMCQLINIRGTSITDKIRPDADPVIKASSSFRPVLSNGIRLLTDTG